MSEEKRLPKNIVVCADGTGNKGGYSPDSNVYKVYKTVDKNFKGKCHDNAEIEEQVLFYDNGVGTAKNKFLRAITGAFGFGFERNVCDLYKFIARSYEDGDRIYFFGFSRGASTVRACNGMIAKCGLVKGKGLRNCELDERVEEAFKAYKELTKSPELAKRFKEDKDRVTENVPIQFLGVWDTVVALGFPKRTDITGPISFVLNMIFESLEFLADRACPHSFYYYKLTDNVKHACQALAIDDERTAFWPFVWQEKNLKDTKDRTEDNVEQVWFAGMHSNVGGGYERAGMAGVPLYWMMKRAEHHGLMFTSDALKDAHDASHVHGRMYNSRDGLALLYRYHPREMLKLCQYKDEGEYKDKLLGNIKIHHSVIDRIKHRTANYAPGHIPASFDVVDDAIPAKSVHHNPGSSSAWLNIKRTIDKWVLWRKRLYNLFFVTVLGIFFSALYLWFTPPEEWGREGVWGSFANFLDYISPDMFDGLIEVAIVQKPYLFLTTMALLFIYYVIRTIWYRRTLKACEQLRHKIIGEKLTNTNKAEGGDENE
ncbi:MAG: DUF2235 domain-containing protein [Gammaproteobacteria bacterium]|nr:DUF2235 domain-containing protein [Gammaproteobacteria bacterium]